MNTAGVGQSPSTRERLESARQAAREVGRLSTVEKNEILTAMAAAIHDHRDEILTANQADLAANDLSVASCDRLLLNPQRIAAIQEGILAIRALPDPLGEVLAEWTRPNGLRIRKVRVPLGVVGIVYESRPNVTVDAASLCLKAGNAVVLRGGREASKTNTALVEVLRLASGIGGAIQLLDSRSRESVEELMRARGLVDVLIPRGGTELIDRVVAESIVPVIETGAGNCHIYVDKVADLDLADRIVLNAKTQRPCVCNAAEKLLIHESISRDYVPRIVSKLLAAGVEVRGDQETQRLAQGQPVRAAVDDDWNTEYLALCIAVAVVPSLDHAIAHINKFSSANSDAIVTSDEMRARRFLREVDSAAVYWNASTRFTDGGEFGFGAEMGVSTQKLHCRGPFGLSELTSTKYEILGTGQIRQ
jgi:glutamate-5-semialdehyde dehydrogenase